MSDSRLERLPRWDKRFLELADLVSTWSKDPSTKVGAVIVDQHQRVVSIGFNGLPRGMVDSEEILNNRNLKLLAMIHAEENAIMFAERDLTGCTIYISPMPPCGPCASKIRQSGIVRVVAPNPTREQLERWEASFDVALMIYADGVALELV